MFSSKNGAGMMMTRPVFLDEAFSRKLDLSSSSSSSASSLLHQLNKSHEGSDFVLILLICVCIR